ncbi:MAG TPA: M24 family metallopeptidase [Gaiellales bacterium]
MVHADELRERQVRMRAAAGEAGVLGVIALGRAFYDRPGACAWLTGHHPPFLAASSHPGLRGAGFGAFVLPVEGPTTLVCDPTGAREDIVVADEIRAVDDVWCGLADTLRARGLTRGPVGLLGEDLLPADAAAALATALPDLRLRGLDTRANELRQVKSASEQATLARAAACADAALAVSLDLLRAGASERETAAAGTAAAISAGADHVRYLRVHSGGWSERTARWPPALDRVPLDGELVMVDVIGACDGYAFDVARTIVLGDASSERRALLDACAAATDAAAGACRAGSRIGDVLEAAAAVYEAAGLGAHARSFAGHGIGIETVEAPLLSPVSAELELHAGMVLCVEPGIAIAGVGGALIEHELVVTSGAPRLLCRTPTLA